MQVKHGPAGVAGPYLGLPAHFACTYGAFVVCVVNIFMDPRGNIVGRRSRRPSSACWLFLSWREGLVCISRYEFGRFHTQRRQPCRRLSFGSCISTCKGTAKVPSWNSRGLLLTLSRSSRSMGLSSSLGLRDRCRGTGSRHIVILVCIIWG